ncbi:SDR family oxidoreductase [Nonomuraea sp. NPDC050790]|uniref:SDR family oxidoreductase n=1 Tax=Nonomuraea sp. NPDC050790 TaxID=3364371 RepID=UPI0037BD3B49
MTRTYVVTGADSGIGALTAGLLADRGARVIRCGVGESADVRADLGTADGRAALLGAVERLAPSGVDGLALVAGIAAPTEATVRVNHFGTLAVLRGLRPLLARSSAPRAVVVSSASSLSAGDGDVIAACLREDEPAAVAAARRAIGRGRGAVLYRSTKIALNRWVRRAAPGWAESGIPLNVVAPGIVGTETAMTTMLATPAQAKLMAEALPQPLGFPGPADAVAEALAWTLSPANAFMTGQVIYVDGGADATLRGDGPYADGVSYGPVAMARMIFWSLAARVQRRRTGS